jgi:hypothetical protein
VKQEKLQELEEIQLEKVKDELYKKERELLNFVELVEEKKII